ncbi:MAG TPA: MarR family transcriptional regulator [Steroidobacteraceae bacterium]
MSTQHYHVEDYKPCSSVGYLVKRTYALMLDALEPAFAEHGFTFTQYVILMQLRADLALNLRDISLEFRHDSGALTRVIDQLAERGLVERQRCAEDRRKVDLHLTAAGRKTCDELIPLVVDKLNHAVAGFTRTEHAELLRLLGKFIAGMQAGRSSGAA